LPDQLNGGERNSGDASCPFISFGSEPRCRAPDPIYGLPLVCAAEFFDIPGSLNANCSVDNREMRCYAERSFDPECG